MIFLITYMHIHLHIPKHILYTSQQTNKSKELYPQSKPERVYHHALARATCSDYRCYLDLHNCSRYYATCHINITWFRQEFYTLKSVDPTSPARDISFRRVHEHCN